MNMTENMMIEQIKINISFKNTDYILTKKENYNKALECLSNAGYEMI